MRKQITLQAIAVVVAYAIMAGVSAYVGGTDGAILCAAATGAAIAAAIAVLRAEP